MVKVKQDEDQSPRFLPDFLHVPAAVAFDKELQPLDSKVYGIVYWLERLKDGRCFASNATIAKLTFSSASGVANSLARLKDRGYLIGIYDDRGQRKEIKTLVFNTVNPYSNEEGGVTQMSNIGNNTKKENISSDLTKQQKDEITKIYKLWLIRMKIDPAIRLSGTPEEKHDAFLEASKSYRLTQKRRDAIARRLNDAGYDMIVRAISNLSLSPFHRDGDNDNGWKADLADFLLRSYEKVEEWASKNNKEEQ